MGIYFIQADKGGPIKIGLAKEPKGRLSSLQSATHVVLKMLAFVDGGRAAERSLHQKFTKAHLRGEWFNPDSALLEFISTLPPPPDLKRKPIRSWHQFSPEKIERIKKIWFDKTIPGDRAAAKQCGLSYQTIKNNLGPSGRISMWNTPGFAKAAQAKSVEARHKRNGRMPKEKARAIWFNDKLNKDEAAERCGPGWSWPTLYRHFGPRREPRSA